MLHKVEELRAEFQRLEESVFNQNRISHSSKLYLDWKGLMTLQLNPSK